MNTAVIDLGTNTFNLLIGRVVDGQIVAEHRSKISVKLGKGGFSERRIEPDAYERGIRAIEEHMTKLTQFDVDHILAYATSAVRDASNGEAFVAELKVRFGIDVQIIDGDREAELICEGVKASAPFGDERLLIMDIGGGSTEFIIAQGKNIEWKKSYPLGVSRILEQLTPEDPISKENTSALEELLSSSLNELKSMLQKFPTRHLVGSSGSFDTLSELIIQGKYGKQEGLKGNRYDFRLEDYYEIHEKLLFSNLKERLEMPGMIEMRAEMMVVSSAIIHFIITQFNFEKMTLSTYALKEGALILNQEQ